MPNINIARKRRPPKTYSRRPPAASHSPKRRRLLPEADTPQSPPRSSPAPDTSDTPASPRSSPPPPKKKPTFTFFTRTIPHRAVKPTPTKQKPLQKLTQSIIDLGQALRTTCKTCGMSYHPSTPDDEALHKRFHAKSVGGVDFPPCSKGRVVWKGEGGEEVRVLLVDRKSSVPEKRKVREVMEVVDVDLGAGEITDAVLWEEGVAGERFKVYLYIQGKKCIGLLLAERITKAFYVLNDTPPKPEGEGDSSVTESRPPSLPTASSSVSISSTPQKALLGISRIWACSSHRRQGVARKLLECARSTFIYGMTVEKGHMAFSQPTESGGGLARGWFGGEEEWKVYVEQV